MIKLTFSALTLLNIASLIAVEQVSLKNSSISLSTENDKTYFLEQSQNLNEWTTSNHYVLGDGTLQTISFSQTSLDKAFFRFYETDTNTSSPDDTDGDGINNSHEIELGLNPVIINSVNDLAITEIDTRIKGTTPSSSIPLFTNYNSNGANLIFERNSECWLSDIDNVSCLSPWLSLIHI